MVDDVVAGVADRQLDLLAGVGGEVHLPLLVPVARAAGGRPLAGAAGRRARAVAEVGLVVLEERVQLEPERTDEAGVRAAVPVEVGQGRPVVGADGVGLDEHEVPVRLGLARDPEREGPAARRDGDGAGEPLVGEVGGLGERELGSRARRDRGEQVGVDRVPVPDAAGAVGTEIELPDRRRREVGRHRLLGVPDPCGPSVPRAAALERAVGDRLEARGHGDPERVGGLVERVVVHRVPRRGDVGLAGDERPVVGVDEAGEAELRVADRLGHAVVRDAGGEPGVLAQPALRGDGQLAAVAAPRRPGVRRR